MTDFTTPAFSIVIPAYNAAAFIAGRLTDLAAGLDRTGLSYEIVVVDDGSEDDTARVLREIPIRAVRPVTGLPHRGKFGAIRAGVERAQGDCIVLTDADVPYEIPAIPYMVSLLRHHEFHLVVGDRTLPGSIYESRMPFLRRVATRTFTWIIRVLVTGGLHDTQCGLKSIRGDIARALFPLLREDGFSGDVELLYVALKYNLAIRRIPVRLQFQGSSTVRPLRHGATMLKSILRIRRRYRRREYVSPVLADLSRQDYWDETLSAPGGVDSRDPDAAQRRLGDLIEIPGDYQHRALNEGPRIQRAWHQAKLELLDWVFRPRPGDHVLDIGCGSGVVADALARGQAVVTAIDANPQAVAYAKSTFAREGLRVLEGYLDALDLPLASFDAAFCLEIIEHVHPPQIKKLLGDIRRLLKPGGHLMVTTPNYRGLWPVVEWLTDRFGPTAHMHGDQHVTHFHRRRLREFLVEAGFEVLTLRTYCTIAPFAAAASLRLSRALDRFERRFDLPFGNLLVALARNPESPDSIEREIDSTGDDVEGGRGHDRAWDADDRLHVEPWSGQALR